jgi:hypothetical protein
MVVFPFFPRLYFYYTRSQSPRVRSFPTATTASYNLFGPHTFNFNYRLSSYRVAMAKRNKDQRVKSAATPASIYIDCYYSAVHQPREITRFCWILDLSDRSFSVDIEDSLKVDHLKDVILKKNPVSFA